MSELLVLLRLTECGGFGEEAIVKLLRELNIESDIRIFYKSKKKDRQEGP